MKNRYFEIFIIFAAVLLIILSYLRFPCFRYFIRAALKAGENTPEIHEETIPSEEPDNMTDNTDTPLSYDMIKSSREEIHTVMQDGIWRIEDHDFIPQFGGDLQNTGVYPGYGIRDIQIGDGGIGSVHEGKFVYKIRYGGIINSAPAVYDRIIYFGTSDGHFYSVNIDSGMEKWVVRIGSASEKKMDIPVAADSCPPAPAIFSSPVIYDGVAYFGTAYGYVYALDIKDGSIIWKAEIPGLHLANPKVDKDCLYIGSKDRHLYKLDAKTGDMVWMYKTQGEIITTPAIYENRVFINSQDSHLYAIDTEGNLSWKIDLGVPTKNSPVAYEGIVFLGTDYLHAISTKNGSETWRTGQFQEVSQYAASMGRVYFFGVIDDKGKDIRYNYLYSLIAENGKEEWKYEISSWKIDPNLPAEYISEVLEPEIPGKQVILSGDMIHLLFIGNEWRRRGIDPFHRGTGAIIGIPEDMDEHHRRRYSYSYDIDELHSPGVIYDEVMYYGAEITKQNDCYTALYAIQSMQDKWRWQPWPADLFISYPLVSENVAVLYDIAAKEGDNVQKGRDSNIASDQYTAEFQIAAYDTHSNERLYSGTCDIEEIGPLTIFERSSAIHSGKLFLEAARKSTIEKEMIPKIRSSDSGIIRKEYETHLISSTYYAFDMVKGKFIWKYDLGEKILNSPPLIYEDKIYIGSWYMINDHIFTIPNNLKDAENIFMVLDTKNGEEIWKIDIIGNVLSKPLIYNDILYFGTDKGYIYAIDRFEGEILWRFYINGGICTNPAVHNDIIYIGSCNWNIYAMDAKTGKGICKYRTRGRIWGELFANQDHLYCTSSILERESNYSIHINLTYLQSINIKTGIEKWNILSPRYGISQILLDYDMIYLLSRGNLKAIDIKTGSIMWDIEINHKDFHYISSSNRIIKVLEDKLNLILLEGKQPLDVRILTIEAKTGETVGL